MKKPSFLLFGVSRFIGPLIAPFTIRLKFLLAIQLFAVFSFLSFAAAAPLPTSLSGPDVLNGKEITVALEKKKGMVVVFLSAVCPCSASHVDELKALSREFPDIAFVGVHANASEAKDLSQAYFNKSQLPFPVVRDHDYKLADQFKALKTPHAFVLSPGGEVVYQGGVSNSRELARADRKFLREALDDLENQRPVKTKEGRTLGCAITRGEKYAW